MALQACRKQAERRLLRPKLFSVANVISPSLALPTAAIHGRCRSMRIACWIVVAGQRSCSLRAIRSGTASAARSQNSFDAGEWIAHPAPSTFSLAAARLGWRIESVACLGLHAAPFERLLPHLVNGARIICLVSDGKAGGELAAWLTERGWGASQLWALSALGGARESVRPHRADSYAAEPSDSLITIALEARGSQGLPRSSGLSDDLFVHDGQITKQPMRALALSALSPRPGERLWDIGAGSGSISVEWALCGGNAIAIEAREDRVANIHRNAAAFGLTHRMTVIQGTAPDILADLDTPDAVFIGGGLDDALFDAVWSRIAVGTRLVVHSVTLETEALLAELQQRHGGELMRVEIAHAAPLGRYRSWQASRPIVQWSAIK